MIDLKLNFYEPNNGTTMKLRSASGGLFNALFTVEQNKIKLTDLTLIRYT